MLIDGHCRSGPLRLENFNAEMTWDFPGSPSTASAGTMQSWNTSSQVLEARMPSLSSFLPTENPGVPFSSTTAVIPLYPRDRSSVAKNDENTALICVRNPKLLPVQHVVIAFSPSSCLQRERI